MSYSIYIGEAKPEYPSEDNDWRFSWAVDRITHPDAPVWDCKPDRAGNVDMSGQTNGRHPGDVQFKEFCIKTGLVDLFFKDDICLIRDRPGIVPLLPLHIKKIKEARQDWEYTYPDSVPGWNEGEDAVLASLIWYGWWMKWALENCSEPAVENY